LTPRPQLEIGLAEARLDLDRALRIGQPVFGDVTERLHHVGDLVGRLDLDVAVLARLEVGGERLAAFLDHRAMLRENCSISTAGAATRRKRCAAAGAPARRPALEPSTSVHALPARRLVLRTLVLGFVILFGINLV
jgi:hypothetical protein